MSKNHFLYSYVGNKREESETMKNLIKYDNIKNIIEPFCGTSALSYKIWQEHKEKFKYYLNDKDEDLIKIYELLKNETIENIENQVNNYKNTTNNKEDWNRYLQEYKETKNIFIFIFIKKYSNLGRFGLYGASRMPKSDFIISTDTKNFIKFIKSPNVFISSGDWFDIFDKYKNDEKTVFLFDPPYLMSCNDFYNLQQDESKEGKKNNIYEYFYNNPIESFKSNIYLILENIWLIKSLYFNSKKLSIYKKNYSISKKQTEHIIIFNK
jgi:site-specific DNA-adenine methylase